MGRELKRVPLDFDWPINKVWKGFINPYWEQSHECPTCRSERTGSSTGYSPYAQHLYEQWYGYAPFSPPFPFSRYTPGVMEFATRNVTHAPEYYGGTDARRIEREADRLLGLWNSQLSHHLNPTDVKALVKAGRLMDFTHTWTPEHRWQPKSPPYMPTAKEVNEWSISSGFGHDSINCSVVIRERCKRAEEPEYCAACAGEARLWPSESTKDAYENWQKVEPPEGPGYQIWETVSEGSPISPVFSTPEDLARHMATTSWGADKGTSVEQWLAFINGPGWAPSLVMHDGVIETGVQATS